MLTKQEKKSSDTRWHVKGFAILLCLFYSAHIFMEKAVNVFKYDISTMLLHKYVYFRKYSDVPKSARVLLVRLWMINLFTKWYNPEGSTNIFCNSVSCNGLCVKMGVLNGFVDVFMEFAQYLTVNFEYCEITTSICTLFNSVMRFSFLDQFNLLISIFIRLEIKPKKLTLNGYRNSRTIII